MDTREQEQLAKRARRAYEFGRIRRSIRCVWPVVLLTAVAAVVGDPIPSISVGLGLAAVAAVLFYRGRRFDRSVETGFKAGIIPMVIALAMWQGQGCSGPASLWCFPLCAGTSLLVGAWLGAGLRRPEALAEGTAALLISILTASLGCAVLGLGTLLGVAVGLVVGMTPVWIVRAFEAQT